jgi:MFS family permease
MNETAVIQSEGTRSVEGTLAGHGAGRRKWTIVAAALVGNLVGVNVLLLYTIGIFFGALQQEFGWSRADLALSATWFTVVVFIGTPLVGRVADRFNPGHLAALSMLAVGALLMSIPLWIHTVGLLWFGYLSLAVLGLGTSPAVINKQVVASFSKGRGLALGAALSGAGIGTFVAPRLAAALIERGGWRLGYVGLGVFSISVAPIIWFGLGGLAAGKYSADGDGPVAYPGTTFGEAIRFSVFWRLSLISVLAGLGMAGTVTHLVPFLRDYAMSPAAAAALASLLGVSSIVARFVTGFTLDRVDGPLPGLPFLGIGALGVAILVTMGASAASIGILFLGFVLGAEFDLLAYFASRYFGLRSHAALFGWNYGMVAFGAAIAPPVMGILRDQQGSYTLGFTLCGGFLCVAALLCPFLGQYRFAR